MIKHRTYFLLLYNRWKYNDDDSNRNEYRYAYIYYRPEGPAAGEHALWSDSLCAAQWCMLLLAQRHWTPFHLHLHFHSPLGSTDDTSPKLRKRLQCNR